MTHPYYGYHDDPIKAEAAGQLERLLYLIGQFNYLQMSRPDLADQWQERIDKYALEFNSLRKIVSPTMKRKEISALTIN